MPDIGKDQMSDIIFPNNNEAEFIAIAEKLNIRQLVIVYDFKKYNPALKENLNKLQQKTKIKLTLGLVAEPQNIIKAKKLCSFVIALSSKKDQQVIEAFSPNLIFNLETDPKKDKSHYRLSGLNQVLCKLASQKNTIIGISFSELLRADKKIRPIILGRIIQNLRFCKKYNCQVLLASFAAAPFELRAEKDLKSLKTILE